MEPDFLHFIRTKTMVLGTKHHPKHFCYNTFTLTFSHEKHISVAFVDGFSQMLSAVMSLTEHFVLRPEQNDLPVFKDK